MVDVVDIGGAYHQTFVSPIQDYQITRDRFFQGLIVVDRTIGTDNVKLRIEMLNGSLAPASLGLFGTGAKGIHRNDDGRLDETTHGIRTGQLYGHRVSRKQKVCSAETGASCLARKRLPEKYFSDVARQTGSALDSSAKEQWLWKGRRVLAYDGSTVSMPDTPENQQAYPQPPQQKPGVGFPLARIAAFFSLSCGAVIDLGICRNSGKGNSELGMLRKMWNILHSGDVLLADRYLCAWHEIFLLQERGVHSVTRLNVHRSADFRRGRRLGKGDHVVQWRRPGMIRSIDWQTLQSLPEFLTIRETRVQEREIPENPTCLRSHDMRPNVNCSSDEAITKCHSCVGPEP